MLKPLIFVLVLTVTRSSIAEEVADIAADQEIAVQSPLAVVTREDLHQYVKVQASSVSSPDEPFKLDTATVQRMAENLYMLEALVAEAKKMPGFDEELSRWKAQVMYNRSVVDSYRNRYVALALRDVNWEATAKEAYVAQKDLYMTQEAVRVSHILVKTSQERSEEEALETANDLRERALNGEDFSELARAHSEDPSAVKNDGDMGYFTRGRMVEPFEKAAFAMTNEGEISEPVLSPFGYHVIRYHGRKAPEQIPFEDVKDRIVVELKEQLGVKVWRDKLIAMRSDPGLRYNENIIEQISSGYASGLGEGD